MKLLRMLFLIGTVLSALQVLASGPDPIPWPRPNPPGNGLVMQSGPDPIPWPTPGISARR